MKCRMCRWLRTLRELDQPGFTQGRHGPALNLRDLVDALSAVLRCPDREDVAESDRVGRDR